MVQHDGEPAIKMARQPCTTSSLINFILENLTPKWLIMSHDGIPSSWMAHHPPWWHIFNLNDTSFLLCSSATLQQSHNTTKYVIVVHQAPRWRTLIIGGVPCVWMMHLVYNVVYLFHNGTSWCINDRKDYPLPYALAYSFSFNNMGLDLHPNNPPIKPKCHPWPPL